MRAVRCCADSSGHAETRGRYDHRSAAHVSEHGSAQRQSRTRPGRESRQLSSAWRPKDAATPSHVVVANASAGSTVSPAFCSDR